MFKLVILCLLITLTSCGDDGGTSNRAGIYETDKVIIDYKADLRPSRIGENVAPSLFEIPAEIGEDELVKISFVFNSLNFRYFKPIYLGNSCGKVADTRFINLENQTLLNKVNDVYSLEKHTDYSLEVYIEKSNCRDPEITISSWLGNSTNISHIRSCIADLGNGEINFRHNLENSYPQISLGEFNTDFLGEDSFCGQKIKIRKRTCKNLIPNFSWKCDVLGHDGKKYQFELNYHSGLNSGAYACKVGGVPIQLAQLSSCSDFILDK